jgi:ABC-2 type transport system permease protein
VRFLRQRSRVIGALVQPIVFWILLGGGLSASFRPPGAPDGTGYLEYFFPGTIALVLLFTAIFATIAVVEDRKSGFLQGVLVAPVSRQSIVLGQALGATTLAVVQGLLFLVLAPLAGIPLTVERVVATVATMAIVGRAHEPGLLIAWRMESTQGFHAIMNLLPLPIWFLSGAFFPATDAPTVLRWIMRLDPLTYGLAALRTCLYLGRNVSAELPALGVSLAISALFGLVTFAGATVVAQRWRCCERSGERRRSPLLRASGGDG